MNSKGKRFTFSTAAVGLAVLVAAGFVAKHRILEDWWIWRISSIDDAEVSIAAKKLGELRSAKAAPYLVRRLAKFTDKQKGELFPILTEAEFNGEKISMREYLVLEGTWKVNDDVRVALINIGAPAVRYLAEALEDEDTSRLAVILTLGEMGPAAHEAVPALVKVSTSENPSIRDWAKNALKKIQPH